MILSLGPGSSTIYDYQIKPTASGWHPVGGTRRCCSLHDVASHADNWAQDLRCPKPPQTRRARLQRARKRLRRTSPPAPPPKQRHKVRARQTMACAPVLSVARAGRCDGSMQLDAVVSAGCGTWHWTSAFSASASLAQLPQLQPVTKLWRLLFDAVADKDSIDLPAGMGMRVRMGVATGTLLPGSSPLGSAVMELAKGEPTEQICSDFLTGRSLPTRQNKCMHGQIKPYQSH